MSGTSNKPKAILRDGEVYLRAADGSYVHQQAGALDPALRNLSDADIDREIDDDPDAAPEPSDEDLKRARVVKPLQSAKS